MVFPRVSLLPHRNDWTEIQKDAVKVIETVVATRATNRPGDIVKTPWTIGFVQRWLVLTKARRRGRDYARDVLAELQHMDLLRDTGEVETPRKQPSRLRSYWWRMYEIVPVARVVFQSKGAYSRTPEPALPVTGSLCRLLGCQGLRKAKRTYAKGSVQWVFQNCGPP